MSLRTWPRRFARRLSPSGDLAERTLISGVWVFAMKVLNRGLQLVLFLVLGRLLGPAVLGLYGVAMIALAALSRFTEPGLSEALIQRREEDVDDLLHTAWGIEIVRGVFIAAILFVAAPFIGTFFDEPSATNVLRVMALSPLLLGIRNPGVIYFRKSLEFHKQFGYQVSGSVVQFAVGIGLGFYWRSIWALVVAYLAMDLTRTAVSYYAHGFRPRFELDLDVVRDLIGYGKWITGSTILYFFYDRGDDAVVGWLLASTALGWYQMAYRMANAPATEISGTLSNVLFPTFSRLQDDPVALREAFYRAFQITLFVAFPMSFGIVAVAPVFVRTFLGPDWIPMTTTLQLLAIFGLQMAIGPSLGSLWKAVGRPDFATKLSVVRVGLMAVLVVPATLAYGIEGTAAVLVFIGLVAILPIDAYLLVEHTLETTYRRFLSEIAYPFAASVAMFGVVFLVRETVTFTRPIVELVALVLVGVVAYGAAVSILILGMNWDITRNLRWVMSVASRGSRS